MHEFIRRQRTIARWLPVLLASVGLAALPATGPAGAAATVLFEDTFSPQQPGWSFSSPSPGFLGELNNNVNVAGVDLTVSVASAGPGTLAFDLLSFRTLDDATSCCTDVLTFSVNGVMAFSGAFGDRGSDSFLSNPNGATMTAASAIAGGFTRRVSVPVDLRAGANTFGWSYSPLQPHFDEAWGLDNVVLTGEAVGEFEINVTTFIPGNSILAPVPWRYRCLNNGDLYFRGDTRAFGPTADSYRTRQLVTVIADESVDADGIKDGTAPFNDTGPTTSYAADALPVLDDSDDDGVLGDCHLLHGWGKAIANDMHVDVKPAGKTVTVELTGSAANPLVQGAPAIDWSLRLIIDATSSPATYHLTGWEDGFPAFEVYINGSPIYLRNAPPPYTWEDLKRLRDRVGDVDVDISGDLT
jgi:hypothetical protein